MIAGSDIGVQFTGISVTSGLVEGNLIGTNIDGTAALPNQVGVEITAAASGITVGGTSAGAGNLVSGNMQDGIGIDGVLPRTTSSRGT